MGIYHLMEQNTHHIKSPIHTIHGEHFKFIKIADRQKELGTEQKVEKEKRKTQMYSSTSNIHHAKKRRCQRDKRLRWINLYFLLRSQIYDADTS